LLGYTKPSPRCTHGKVGGKPAVPDRKRYTRTKLRLDFARRSGEHGEASKNSRGLTLRANGKQAGTSWPLMLILTLSLHESGEPSGTPGYSYQACDFVTLQLLAGCSPFCAAYSANVNACFSYATAWSNRPLQRTLNPARRCIPDFSTRQIAGTLRQPMARLPSRGVQGTIRNRVTHSAKREVVGWIKADCLAENH